MKFLCDKRKYLLFFVFLMVSVCLYFSTQYRISPFLVGKLITREMILECLERFYHIYDPWSSRRKVAILKPNSDSSIEAQYFIVSVQDFLSEIEKRSLPFKTISFENYSPRNSSYEFYYAPYDPKRMNIVYQTLEGLVNIKKIANDLERAIALRNFVKSLWKHGVSGMKNFDAQNFDALKIVEFARQGERFWCQVYALVYTELANYVGLTSRLVMLSRNGYHYDHGVVEVWSNFLGKWVLMDPDFNIHYEVNGVPLNAVELHNFWVKRQWDTVEVQKGLPRPVGYEVETRSKYKLLDLYNYVRIDLRNDYFWNRFPKGHPAVSDENTLLWFDEFVPPILSFEKKTSKYSNFYWSLNYVQFLIDPYNLSKNSMRVCFDTLTPWFSSFYILIDGKPISWKHSCYNWTLHRGMNSLRVCPENKFGNLGICSELEIQVLN